MKKCSKCLLWCISFILIVIMSLFIGNTVINMDEPSIVIQNMWSFILYWALVMIFYALIIKDDEI